MYVYIVYVYIVYVYVVYVYILKFLIVAEDPAMSSTSVALLD